ncbi:aminoacetone oxidase family FAD-binding enzyme [Mailhella massiliensis]|uniref:Aminoacetone oxidase family FAD-binding enzyme n=1 Tax=Mailhella massiliensis TaxID=1903261 RepID=A0A921DRJ7_9BACT|nr:aminoacetone oxidase family FAD-binding enzyme [Mailhella massiliensis]HJD97714.1 aminoacetone oxidase family FAD-binding enzyme [Mailhella massiliensis]
MPCYDAAIIGAGPAGLLCARNAARAHLRVALIDSHEEPGAKLSLAGGGRGNITNRIIAENRYISGHPERLRAVLRAFPCEKALDILRELSLPFEERDFGQIFGLRPAYLLAERLALQCDDAGVDFYLGRTARDIALPAASSAPRFGAGGKRDVFSLLAGKEPVQAKRLVVAAGSPAFPAAGSSGAMAGLAGRWGHKVIPFRPVLTPLVMPQNWPLAGLEGIGLNVRAGLLREGRELFPDPEGIRPLLFTHKGISGPAALVLSCWWQEGDEILLDFLPELPVLELLDAKESGKMLARNILARRLPARLADALCPEDIRRRKAAELSRKDRLRLASAVHRFRARPTGTEGMKKAEAAAGGVCFSSLSRRLESLIVPGLFFCGEVVDATGLLGGYNIHWAFASGALVAKALQEGQRD